MRIIQNQFRDGHVDGSVSEHVNGVARSGFNATASLIRKKTTHLPITLWVDGQEQVIETLPAGADGLMVRNKIRMPIWQIAHDWLLVEMVQSELLMPRLKSAKSGIFLNVLKADLRLEMYTT